MRKLKDAHVFSNEEGSIAKWFTTMCWAFAMLVTSNILTSLINKEPIEWWGILLTTIILISMVTVVYFITRLLAYRTKIFPKTENREGVHGVSFIFLLLLTIILLLIFV